VKIHKLDKDLTKLVMKISEMLKEHTIKAE